MKSILEKLKSTRQALVNKIFRNSSAKNEPKFYYNAIEIAAKATGGNDPEYIKIVPVGVFPTHPDGPHEITPDHITEMAANIKNGGTDLLFDFGHDSLYCMGAEAAGWSPKDLVQAKADGLYVKYPVFTTDGQEKVNGKAYRYFSPVYCLESFDKNGKEIGAILHSVGLVNTPYMDTEIDAIGNSKFKKNKIEDKMNKALLIFLGLAETATETEVTAKLNSLRTEFKLPETATMTEIINAATTAGKEFINAAKVCKNCGGTMKKNGSVYECPDCGATIPVDKKNSDVMTPEEITALKNSVIGFEKKEADRLKADAEVLVNSAIADGKILPAFKDQFVNDAVKNFATVKADLDARIKNSALPHKPEIKTGDKVDLNDSNAIANSARIYMKEMADKGITISNTEAVNHVYQAGGGKL
jgi:phage I-like protein